MFPLYCPTRFTDIYFILFSLPKLIKKAIQSKSEEVKNYHYFADGIFFLFLGKESWNMLIRVSLK